MLHTRRTDAMTTRNYGNVTVDRKAYWTSGLHGCRIRCGPPANWQVAKTSRCHGRRRGVMLGVGVWTAASFCATSRSRFRRRRIRHGGDLQGGVICQRCNAKAVNLAGSELRGGDSVGGDFISGEMRCSQVTCF